jgi:hypothetical protein
MIEVSMQYLTLNQKPTDTDFAKAGELIEIRGHGSLTLHDRRILNLLYENAGSRICDDIHHTMPISLLRGNHKGGERVSESIIRLMTTLVEVPVKGKNNKAATLRAAILSETTTSNDEGDPTGEVTYAFSKTMRDIIKDSTYWGRVRGAVMFAFTSKYSLALYELICLRINLKKWHDKFRVEEFRSLLGVPEGKLLEFKNLNSKVIQPALLEVNGMADFGVKIEPIRQGGKVRGNVTGFTVAWWRKDVPELKKAYEELKRAKVGRIARLAGKVEETKSLEDVA